MTVIAAAIAAEKSGPFWGGLVVGLPTSAGPAYVMLAIDYDDAFLAVSSLNSLAGNTGAMVFLVVLAYAAPRLSMIATLALATGIWLVVAAAIGSLSWTLPWAVAINGLSLAAAVVLTRNIPAGPPTGRAIQPRWFDLPVRGTIVGLFVAGVVSLGHVIGPAATGIVTVYPVTLTSLVLLAMPRLGGQTTAATMASIVRSMIGFSAGFLLITVTVESWGAVLSLSAALAVMIAWAGLRMAHRWVNQRGSPPAPG
ncbi:MAG: hypothetical protein O3C65_15310 [Proteobacteria bacterium]|nr:hypothetical protein [Pseudomonadota bacterium]MDA1060043.1 hypothetical protein [Pseudomonadota bacterium]